jgi:hypothetical protein
VFVTHLASTVTNSDLFSFFARHFGVNAAWVVRNNSNRSLNYGFVELLHENDVALALELNGQLLH